MPVFDLEKLFNDVFAPQKDESVTIMHDFPHGKISDNQEWVERRKLARSWHKKILSFSDKYEIKVNPVITYESTGLHNCDLPEFGFLDDRKIKLEDIIKESTIIIVMPEFSASAPLIGFTKKYKKLRIASMPQVKKSMEKTGLAANYHEVSKTCSYLAEFFEKSTGIEVVFSTGHKCYFDISNRDVAYQDRGFLHPDPNGKIGQLINLPSGEVFVCPNEDSGSMTQGELPVSYENETAIFKVENNASSPKCVGGIRFR